jgi:rRNA maturation protein Rpf1
MCFINAILVYFSVCSLFQNATSWNKILTTSFMEVARNVLNKRGACFLVLKVKKSLVEGVVIYELQKYSYYKKQSLLSGLVSRKKFITTRSTIDTKTKNSGG